MRLYIQNVYIGSGNEMNNLKKFLNCNEYERFSLLMLTLEAGLRSCINSVCFILYNDNLFCQMLRFQSDPT